MFGKLKNKNKEKKQITIKEKIHNFFEKHPIIEKIYNGIAVSLQIAGITLTSIAIVCGIVVIVIKVTGADKIPEEAQELYDKLDKILEGKNWMVRFVDESGKTLQTFENTENQLNVAESYIFEKIVNM